MAIFFYRAVVDTHIFSLWQSITFWAFDIEKWLNIQTKEEKQDIQPYIEHFLIFLVLGKFWDFSQRGRSRRGQLFWHDKNFGSKSVRNCRIDFQSFLTQIRYGYPVSNGTEITAGWHSGYPQGSDESEGSGAVVDIFPKKQARGT